MSKFFFFLLMASMTEIDDEERQHLEIVMQQHYSKSARDIWAAVLEHATKEDDHLRQIGEGDRLDDKAVFLIKRECRRTRERAVLAITNLLIQNCLNPWFIADSCGQFVDRINSTRLLRDGNGR
jgi:hypothetical protein